MNSSEQDDLGRPLSVEQSQFFEDSKLRDASGRLMTFYHGSSYEFDVFDTDKIRPIDSDAYYNGFWFSTDPNTLPAWTKLRVRHEVYLNVCNPAPTSIVRETIRETRKHWMRAGDETVFHAKSRSLHDEVRYRLQDMGYDGIIHDWHPEIDGKELESTGQTKVTTIRGTEYLLKKDLKYGGIDLFYYDAQEPDGEGEFLTGYSDLADYLSLQYCTVICFHPNQIKAIDNRTPTLDLNFKSNSPEQEMKTMAENTAYVYTDFFGDDNQVYFRLNHYTQNNNLYLGLLKYDAEFDMMTPYCDVTVNIGALPYLESAIDTNNNGRKMLDFLEKNGFGKATGLELPSGFCWFPVFRFNEDKLREIDPETFAEYAKAHGMDRKPLAQQISAAEKRVDDVHVGKEAPHHER